MEEVSGRSLVVLDAVAAQLGRPLAELFESGDFGDKPPQAVIAAARAGSGRLDWAAIVRLCARLEGELGPERLEQLGFEAIRGLDGGADRSRLRRALDAVVRPSSMLRALKWLIPQLLTNVSVEVGESEGDAVVTATLRRDDEGSAPFFRLAAGMLGGLPTVWGKPRAGVAASITPHRGRYALQFSTSHRADTPSAPSVAPLPKPPGSVPPLRAQPSADAVLAALEVAVCVLDGESHVTFQNAAFERALGLEPLAPPQRLLDRAHPDDARRLQAALLGADGERFELEVRLRVEPSGASDATLRAPRRDRTEGPSFRAFRVTGRSETADPRLGGVVLQLALLVAPSEQQPKTDLLEALPGMVYRVGAAEDDTFDIVSEGARALTGFAPEELVGSRGRSFSSLVHFADRINRRDSLAVALVERRPVTLEYRIQDRDGHARWVMDVATGEYAPTGELLGISGILIDWTVRKRVEDQLLHSQKLDGIGRLAGGIAHDFNNLLGAMLGYADLAKSGLEQGDERRSDIEEIEAAVRRGGELTRQLLSFARKQVIEPRALNLSELLLRVDKLLRRVLGDNIELATLLPQKLWHVFADPGQIEQVIMNLAINARDAMPNGGKMAIEARNVDLERDHAGRLSLMPGDYIEITVIDTGEGMDEETRLRVFEPFFTTKGMGRGTGLGLATVYGTIAQAGGRIFIESTLGQGTAFTIYLPRSEAEAGRSADNTPTGPLPRGVESVLVVEDHALVRRATVRLLEAQGYKVLVAANAGEALDLVSGLTTPLDILVTDVVMPEMSGVQLAERLLKRHPTLRVLFVSGYAESSAPELGPASSSRHAFLAKPFTPLELGRKVREVLDG